MKEIEALEEDFTASETKTVEASSPVLEELAEMDEKVSVPVAATADVVSLDSKRPAASAETSGAHSTMNFKIQGNITMELQFDIGGKVVALEVTETGLTIAMEGGMKFTLPVGEKESFKKAV